MGTPYGIQSTEDCPLCKLRTSGFFCELSRTYESLSVLLNTLEDLSIDGEMCSSAADAMELLALGYYSALIVDFDLPGAVHMARLDPAQRRPVVFAMISAH